MANQVNEIHVVCRGSLNVTGLSDTEFESGWWVVAERHIRPGVLFALHEEKEALSYLQGDVVRLVGKEQAGDNTRLQVLIRRTADGVPWKGGGSGTVGYLWSGGEFGALPVVPCVLPTFLGGGNKPLKSLFEAAKFEWPTPGQLEEGSGGHAGNRRAEFMNVLARLAAALPQGRVPYAFADEAGEPWRLDVGNLKWAAAEGWLLPGRPEADGRVHWFSLTDKFIKEKRSLVQRWSENYARGKPTALAQDADENVIVETSSEEEATRSDPYAEFDAAAIGADAFREEVMRPRRDREGQASFRTDLMAAYRGRCAVTRVRAAEALEAAHIIPHGVCGRHGLHPSNGILLRADLHNLFDAQLLGFQYHGDKVVVEVSTKLGNTAYFKLHGREIFLPEDPALRPSPAALIIRQDKMPLTRESTKAVCAASREVAEVEV